MIRRSLLLALCLSPFVAAELAAVDPPGKSNPPGKSVRGPQELPAQPAVLPSASKVDEGGTATAREEAILAALEKPVTLDIAGGTFADALDLLKRQLHVQIVLDPKGDTLKPDTKEVTIHVSDISGRAALDILLSQLDLDWDVCHEVLWIADGGQIKSTTKTKVYDVADLVLPPGEEDATPEFDPLISLITSTIEPQSWDSAGGAGSLAPVSSGGKLALVVRQTRVAHEQIAKLLADLRAVPSVPKTRTEPAAPNPDGGVKPPAARPNLHSSHSSLTAPQNAEISPDQRAVASGNNQFACDMFAQNSANSQNYVFSPLSITTAMAMAYAGARSETAAEIATVMHFSLDQEKFHSALAALNKDLLKPRPDSKSRLSMASRIWGQQGYQFLDSFQTLNREQYGAELGQLDFVKQPEMARKTINDWIAAHTEQKFKEIIPPGSLDELTRLVLTNAIYFDGKWSKPFDKSDTQRADFFGPGNKVSVAMMSQTSKFGYAKIEGVQILEKPFDDDLAMTILLPAKGAAPFNALRASLSADKLNDWHTQLRSHLVQLDLPRFQLDVGTDLATVLKALGIRRAFDGSPKVADFSGIDGGRELFLHDAFHKAWVDVDEAGAKAAAVTTISGGGGAFESMPQLVNFRVDHPFVFLIRDRNSGAILFLGQVDDPTSGSAPKVTPAASPNSRAARG